MLNCSRIQKALRDSTTWFKIQEEGWNTVSSKTCDIDILKAIVKFPTNKRNGKMDGRNALIAALDASNAACPLIILKEATIKIIYFSHPVSSKIAISDFKLICNS